MQNEISKMLKDPESHTAPGIFGMASEYDFEDSNSVDLAEDREYDDTDSDEDTEDASETDMMKQEEEYTELKEQMYQDKLASLKKQLHQLQTGQHPEYNKRLKKLEQAYKERNYYNNVVQHFEIERVEREYVNEKRASAREFEDKKIELRENLILELEEKKKIVEMERTSMELTGDSMELKPVTTRKLRRRPNDPPPMPEKRRKTSPTLLNIHLDENDIFDDLKAMCRGKSFLKKSSSIIEQSISDGNSFEARIEDGKLFYDKKWFHRGQSVVIESKENGKMSGVITTLGTNEIYIRKTLDHSKIRIYVSQLLKGKFQLKKKT